MHNDSFIIPLNVDGDVLRMSEAADIAELLRLGLLAQADQQRSCCRRACQERCYANAAQQDAADAASTDDKECGLLL